MRRPVAVRAGYAVVLAAAALALGTTAASAGALTAQSIIAGYNLVASGDVTTNADIEGSAVIGGNLSGSGQFFNNSSREPASPTVSVYGTVLGGTQIDNVPGIFYYGAIGPSGSISLNGTGSTKVQNGFPNALGAYLTPLAALATQAAAMSQQARNSIVAGSNSLVFNATTGDSGGVAYFNIAAATLESDMNNATMQFNLSGSASTMIVNVIGNCGTGGACSFVDPGSEHFTSVVSGTTFQPNVLFNFTNETTLGLSSWETAVLAPDAATTTTNALEGFLYTATLNAGGELHNLTFGGTVPPPPSPPASPVPEPASALLLAAGLGAMLRPRRIGASRQHRAAPFSRCAGGSAGRTAPPC